MMESSRYEPLLGEVFGAIRINLLQRNKLFRDQETGNSGTGKNGNTLKCNASYTNTGKRQVTLKSVKVTTFGYLTHEDEIPQNPEKDDRK